MDGTGNQTDGMTALAGQETPPAAASGTSEGAKETPKAARTYTEEEYTRAINEARTKAFSDMMAETGRKYKPVEDENKTLKSTLATNQTSIQEAQATIEKLNEQINELSADDPDKKNLVKKRREVEDVERRLKTERAILESERAALQKERAATNAAKIAKQYGVDETLLLTLSDGSADKMEMLAKILPKATSTVPAAEPAKAAPIVPDSGVTQGGSVDLSRIQFGQNAPSASDMIMAGLKKKK